jgi:hypothetical protein
VDDCCSSPDPEPDVLRFPIQFFHGLMERLGISLLEIREGVVDLVGPTKVLERVQHAPQDLRNGCDRPDDLAVEKEFTWP